MFILRCNANSRDVPQEGLNPAPLYKFKAKYSDMNALKARRSKPLEIENA